MATVKSTLALQDRMSSTLSSITRALDSTLQAMRAVDKQNLGETFAKAAADIKLAQQSVDDFNSGFKNLGNTAPSAINAIDVAMGNLISRGIDKAIEGTKKLVEMSDNYVSTSARLGMVLNNYENEQTSVAELQDMVYQSANRSRGSLDAMSSTVAKLGNQAHEVFGSTKELVQFSEILNKTFTVSGMDATGIESTMYNLTQSLSSGKLLGQDYRILKQNAPQMIKYLRDFYKVNQAELDDMVSKGKVTAQGLKAAMFNAADDVNAKFKEMPLTWSQLGTLAANHMQKALEPLLKIVNSIANWISNNWALVISALEALVVTLGIVTAAWLIYKGVMLVVNVVTGIVTGTISILNIVLGVLALMLFAGAFALIYLWNTNDEAAYKMLEAWENFKLGIAEMVLSVEEAFNHMLNWIDNILMVASAMIYGFLTGVQNMVNEVREGLGLEAVTFEALGKIEASVEERAANAYTRNQDMQQKRADLEAERANLEATRADRVANRKRPGMNLMEDISGGIQEGLGGLKDMSGLVGSDGKGGKALKTTSNDRLLKDEDIKLLLDVATRDYQLNYQQMTPNISVSFGDVRETADVDQVMDVLGDRITEMINGDTEVKD